VRQSIPSGVNLFTETSYRDDLLQDKEEFLDASACAGCLESKCPAAYQGCQDDNEQSCSAVLQCLSEGGTAKDCTARVASDPVASAIGWCVGLPTVCGSACLQRACDENVMVP
jgi:hypothetical protein